MKEVNKLRYSEGRDPGRLPSAGLQMKGFLNEMPLCIFRRKISDKQTLNGCLFLLILFSLCGDLELADIQNCECT